MSYSCTKLSSMKLLNTDELVAFLQDVQSPTSLASQRWLAAGTVSAQLDWQTFCDLKGLLGQECKYSYKQGTLTLEPPRSLLHAQKTSAPLSSTAALKASIVAQLVQQVAAYTANGTSSGLAPVVRQTVGRTLGGGHVYRTADLYIGVSAAHNLDVKYDVAAAAGLVVDVVTGADARDAAQCAEEWFAGDANVQQVFVVHCDAARVLAAQAAAAKGLTHARRTSTDKEVIGAVWRYGRDTRGRKVLLEEIVSAAPLPLFSVLTTAPTEIDVLCCGIYRRTCHPSRFCAGPGCGRPPREPSCRRLRLEQRAQCNQYNSRTNLQGRSTQGLRTESTPFHTLGYPIPSIPL